MRDALMLEGCSIVSVRYLGDDRVLFSGINCDCLEALLQARADGWCEILGEDIKSWTPESLLGNRMAWDRI